MRVFVGVPVFAVLTAVLAQPAAACEQAAATGHAHSMVDPTTTSCVTLDHVMAGEISVSGAWARAMLPGQPAGSGFVTLENKGASADRLTAVSSAAAGHVVLHSMEVVDDVMVMRPVDAGLAIGPGEKIEMRAGGMHLMFLDLDRPFAEGDSVTVTLTFETAGPVEIELPVLKAGAKEAGQSGHTH